MPREGHDLYRLPHSRYAAYFYPRAPRGARLRHAVYFLRQQRISIRVPREGHDADFLFHCPYRRGISIRVPREGHDLKSAPNRGVEIQISIRVPREGHDAGDAEGQGF